MKRIANIRPSILLFLLSSFLIVSCETEDSADVNQDKIYTDFELFYNSNTDETQAIARFRFGGPVGTLLELNDPAKVTFDGEELPFNAFYSGHFKEYSGKIDGGTFTYTNVDGETFENIVPEMVDIAFPSDLDTLTKTESYDLKWVGSALEADQRVGLFIGSWTWGQDALFLQADDGANNIILGKDKLENVQAGMTTFYMDRVTEKTVDEGSSEGGLIRSKFRAENIEVFVQ